MTSNAVLVMPTADAALFREIAQIVGRDLGLDQWGSKVNHTSYLSNTEYAHTLLNNGTGGHLNIPGYFRVENSGVTIDGALTLGGNLGVGGSITAAGDIRTTAGSFVLDAAASKLIPGPTSFAIRNRADSANNLLLTDAGLATVRNGLIVTAGGLTVSAGGLAVSAGGAGIVGNTLLTGDLRVTGNGDIDGNLNVDGVLTAGSLSIVDLTVTGNTLLGNANTDTVTVVGVSTFRNAASSATQLHVDAANNRVIVGSGTAMGSDTTPALQVVGRLYVGPESANDLAIQIRRSLAATAGWSLGVESTNDFIFKDDGDNRRFTLGDTSSTYAAIATGDMQVTGSLDAGDDVTADRVFIGAVSPSGTEEFRVIGQSRFEGAVEITSSGLSVVGSSVFSNGVSITTGGLAVIGGLGLTVTTVNSVSNGGATALPTNPKNYIPLDINGTVVYVATYDP